MYVSIPKKFFLTRHSNTYCVRDMAMYFILKNYSFKGSIHNYKSQYQRICKKYGFCEKTLRMATKRLLIVGWIEYDKKNPKHLLIKKNESVLDLDKDLKKLRLQKLPFTSYRDLITMIQLKTLAIKEEGMIYANALESKSRANSPDAVRGPKTKTRGISRRKLAEWLGYEDAKSATNLIRIGVAKGIVIKDEKRRFDLVEKSVPEDNIYRYDPDYQRKDNFKPKHNKPAHTWFNSKSGFGKGVIVRFWANDVNFLIEKDWTKYIKKSI